LQDHAEQYPGRPFFTYLAFVSPHFPLHAIPEDIARYQGKYDEGWDVIRERRWRRMRELGIVDCALSPLDRQLSPRYWKPEYLEQWGPGEVTRAVPWSELTDEQRTFQARKMAIHAAMVERMDCEIGRVVDQIRSMGVLDDTVIFFLSDNGADATMIIRGEGHDRQSPPGSWRSFFCLGPGWASACNAPFRRHKVWVHEGGISTPLIVHWPRGVPAGGKLRHDVGHVIDFVPTLLDLAGGRGSDLDHDPSAPPLPGRSLVPAFARDEAATRDVLFFHHEGNRAIRCGDWKLVSAREDHDAWELYNLRADRCEMNNLAAEEPERVRRMAALWQELETNFRQTAESR
jgi:arylsulfatase